MAAYGLSAGADWAASKDLSRHQRPGVRLRVGRNGGGGAASNCRVLRIPQASGSADGDATNDGDSGPAEVMDMFVASVDFGDPKSMDQEDETSVGPIVRVPHPRRYRPAVRPGTGGEGGNAQMVHQSQAAARALQIDNAWTTSELKKRNRELARARLTLRTKDKEIQELRASLADRERQLKYNKAALIEARQMLGEKDQQLEDMYEHMYKAAKERSGLREDLVMTEKELQETGEELQRSRSNLVDLRGQLESPTDDEVSRLEAPAGNGAHPRAAELEEGARNGQVAPTEEESMDPGVLKGTLTMLGELVKLSHRLVADAGKDAKMLKQRDVEDN